MNKYYLVTGKASLSIERLVRADTSEQASKIMKKTLEAVGMGTSVSGIELHVKEVKE